MTQAKPALAKAFTAQELRMLAVVSFFMFIDGFDLIITALVASTIAAEWNPPLYILGIVMASAQVGSIVGAAACSAVNRAAGSKITLVILAILLSVGSLACALAPGISLLLVGRFITGVGLGAAAPVVVSYITPNVGSNVRGLAIGIILANLTLGQLVGSLIIPSMISEIGWRGVFMFAAIGSAMQLPFLFRVTNHSVERQTGGGTAISDRPSVERSLRLPLFYILLSAICSTFVGYALATWMPFLAEHQGLSRGLASGSLTTLVAGTVIGNFALGRLMDRVRSPFSLLIVAILCAVPQLLLLTVYSNNGVGLLMIAGLLGLSVVAASISSMTLIGKVFPPGSQITAAALLTMATKAAGILAPVTGGSMLTMGASAGQVFLVVAFAALGAAAFLMLAQRCLKNNAERSQA